METKLAEGYKLRNATKEDATGICEMIYEACKHFGDAEMTVNEEELHAGWNTKGFDLDTDAWVVVSPQNQIVGYEALQDGFEHSVLHGDGYVHPEHYFKGIGSVMLNRLIERSKLEIEKAPPANRVYIRNSVGATETNGPEIHEAAGFDLIRYHWRLEIKLDERPQSGSIPEGIILKPFIVTDHDIQLYEAHHDAFKDHWGHVKRSYDFWVKNIRGMSDYDPALWVVAWDGDEIAGYTLNRIKPNTGWIGTLGVRRPWRKKGLGLFLLQHSFGLLYDRGCRTIGLTVDAANPSGATRLYEKAGMKRVNEYKTYDYELRPGIERADG